MENINKSELTNFVDKFTIGDLLGSNKKTKEVLPTNNASQSLCGFSIEDNVVISLRTIGLSYDQIFFTFKLYRFKSVDEAVHIMLRDIETNKFNHFFFSDCSKNNEKVCQICGNDSKDHIEKDIKTDENINESKTDVKLSVRSKRNSNLNKEDTKEIEDNIKINNKDSSNYSYDNFQRNHQKLSKSKRSEKANPINNEVNIIESKRSANTHSIRNQIDLNEINLDEIDPKNIIKIQQVILPQELVDNLEDPKLCSICYENKKDFEIIFSCNHKFCHSCIVSHLTIRIKDGKVLDLKCLSAGCLRVFTDEEVKRYVPNIMYQKYRKFQIKHLLIQKQNEFNNIVNCPYPDCEEIIQYDLKDDESFVQCEQKHKFCAKCKTEGWHKKSECKIINLIKQIKEKSNSLNYKQCPFCTVIIEKNEGCNQMKCINCNNEFCWICMQGYSQNHYALYNFTGCPGMRFISEKKMRCWDTKLVKILWYSFSCILGLLAFFLVIVFFILFGCSYEFVKCYLERNNKRDSHDEDDYSYENNHHQVAGNTNETNFNNPDIPDVPEVLNKRDKFIIVLIVILGLAMQPAYILFYLLLGLMECYRKFNCWFIY